MSSDIILALIAIVIPFVELLGLVTSFHAVMSTRTSQGAIAWAISLVTFPWLALPLYWIFGRNKFHGYVETLRQGNIESNDGIGEILKRIEGFHVPQTENETLRVFDELSPFPFTHGNHVDLLIDGQATFDAIFESIDAAKDYVLVQFFIFRDDDLGKRLKSRLIEKAKSGVKVCFLYDEIGSHGLPSRYTSELEKAGVRVSAFWTTRGPTNRFQVNFRNHRKIVVVDGKVAYVGGHNVGDEYLGKSKRFGPWRDTHVRITGPSVQAAQLVFTADWYWATRDLPELSWTPETAPGGEMDTLILPTGPTDEMGRGPLFYVHAINSARSRIWIASPYFVPDEPVVDALRLAAMRGVDVRIMLPEKPDHKMVYLASFYYLAQMDMPGIRFFRYEPGFLHQKVVLIDDDIATVGTVNADNRSFRLNFEITMLCTNRKFVKEVEAMLERDFEQCNQATADDYHSHGLIFRFGVKLAHLLSPIL